MDLLLWYNGVAADLRVSGRDLLADDSLYTAVVISLFTDARARAEDELPPELDGRIAAATGATVWRAKASARACGCWRGKRIPQG